MAHKISPILYNFSRAILFSTVMLSAACNSRSLSPPDTLTTAISAPIFSLDPIQATDANTQHVNELIHGTLVRTDDQLTPAPYLAESFRIKGNSIEFTLKKNCRFHNGKILSAKDVEYSFQIFTNAKVSSPFSEALKKVKRFEVLDDQRFRLTLEKPEPALLSHLASFTIFPVGDYDPKNFQNSAIGAGPYRIVKNTGTEISLEKFSSGCLAEAKMPKIKIKVVRDDLSKYLKLKNGELDIILTELNVRKVETIEKDPNSPLAVTMSDGIGYNYIGVNMKSPKLADIRVRRALALSLDLPAIIQYKGKNMATQAKSILADMNFYANKKLPLLERNLPEARRLLDEAGYFNGLNHKPPLRISLKTSTNSIAIENAQVIAANARDVGIELDHRAYEWGIFYNDVKTKNTELYVLRWVGVTDPGIYFDAFHSGELSRNNRTNYSNPALDALLVAAQSTWDAGKRKVLFAKIQEIIARDLPYINLWHVKNFAVYRKNLREVTLHPNGSWQTLLELSKQ